MASAASRRRSPWTGLAIGSPADTRYAGHARSWVVPGVAGHQRSCEHENLVPLLRICLGERGPEKPGSAGDDDFHLFTMRLFSPLRLATRIL